MVRARGLRVLRGRGVVGVRMGVLARLGRGAYGAMGGQAEYAEQQNRKRAHTEHSCSFAVETL